MGRVGGQGRGVAVALHDHALPRDGVGQRFPWQRWLALRGLITTAEPTTVR
jgi:hypothetical protein